MQVQPYLFFNGQCAEAIAFYQAAVGAQVTMQMTYDQSPEAPPPGTVPPGWEKKIMHASFRIGDTEVMASDGCETPSDAGTPAFKGISLALSVDDESEARRMFDALAAGGQVTMPLSKTFFSPAFGMVSDRFGVNWMIVVSSD